MPPITVNWSDLEIAFERNSPDQESFLDLETGELLSIANGEPDAPARRAKVATQPERFLRIDPASSREQYRWMERFVGSVADDALRDRLLVAIDGKGAFRRFKDVLLAFPAERERWFSYRSELLHFHMQTWVEHMKIQIANPLHGGGWSLPRSPTFCPRSSARARLRVRYCGVRLASCSMRSRLPSCPRRLRFLPSCAIEVRGALLGSVPQRAPAKSHATPAPAATTGEERVGPVSVAR